MYIYKFVCSFMHFSPIWPTLMEPTPKNPKFYLVGRAGWRNQKTQPFSNCEFFFPNFHCNFKNFLTAKNQNQVIPKRMFRLAAVQLQSMTETDSI